MMIAIWARSSLSTVTPVGMNSGSITEAMNRIEISGTPRMTSMKKTAMTRIAGSFEARASASTTPSGKPSARPTAVRMKESGRPLHSVVGTGLSPGTPPAIRTMPATTTAAQSARSQRPQKRGIMEMPIAPKNSSHRQGRAPVLLVGIDAEDHEAGLGGQEGQADPAAGPADGRAALGDGARHKPAPGGLDDDPEQPQADERNHRIERRAEERLDDALPISQAVAAATIAASSVCSIAQRSFSATRALYQFMNTEMMIDRPR